MIRPISPSRAANRPWVERRVSAIDAARGAAMMLVCLSHFGAAYLREEQPLQIQLLLGVSMLATPAFLFISGMMLGLLYDRSRTNFAPTRLALIDRALFLLTIAHLAILGAMLFRDPSASLSFRRTFVTDTIGLSLLIGACIVDRIPARTKVALGALVYVTSCALVFTWHAPFGAARELKTLFVGLDPSQNSTYTFSLLPWLGVFLIGSAAGEKLNQWIERGREHRLAFAFAIAGVTAITLGVVVKVVCWVLVGRVTNQFAHPFIYFWTSPWEKYPPGPDFLLFFGGLGAIMLAALFFLVSRSWFAPVARFLRMIGRCSLFVFVLQYYLYLAILWSLRLPHSPWWPLYFVLSIVPLAIAANWWDSRQGNRYLTIGSAAIGSWLLQHTE